MGGRNQKTKVLRKWCGPAEDPGLAVDLPEFSSEALEVDLPITLLPTKPPSFADFSAVGVFEAAPRAVSNGFPGVLGVLAEPKDAKAPEPRAKALDAPPVGEAKVPPGVVTELKGLFPSDELSPPSRFKDVVLRPRGLSL